MIAMLLVLLLLGEEKPPGFLGVGVSFHADAAAARRWLYVRHVAPDGPAARAGVRVGDMITGIGGKPVPFADEPAMLRFFGAVKPGQPLVFTILRGGATRRARIVAAEPPPSQVRAWRANRARAAQ